MAPPKSVDEKRSPAAQEQIVNNNDVAGDEDDDDDDEGSSVDETSGSCCRYIWVRSAVRVLQLNKLYTGYTPFLMWLTVTIVAVVLAIQRSAQEGSVRNLLPYTLYVSISIGIFFLWLIFRAVWILAVAQRLTESRAFVALNAVLDPGLIHLCATVSICLFWAYIPATGSQSGAHQVNVLGIGVIPVDDIHTLLKVNLLLILWAAQDLLLKLLLFYFLTGLLMALNPNIIKYLTIYRLLRKLNANWSRLSPAVTFLRQQSTETSGLSLGDAKAAEDLQETQVAAHPLTTMEAPGLMSLLAPEPTGRPRKDTLAVGVHVGLDVKMMKKHLRAKAEMQKDPERYTPGVLLKSNIEKTRGNAVSNLLALEYCRQSAPVMYLRGRRIQLLHQKDTKQVARELFDQFIEFRNAVSPEEKGQYERGTMASQVITQLQRSLQLRKTTSMKRMETGAISGQAQDLTAQRGLQTTASLRDLTVADLERFTAASAAANRQNPSHASYLGLTVIPEEAEVGKEWKPEFRVTEKHARPPPLEADFITRCPSLLVSDWECLDASNDSDEHDSCLSDEDVEVRRLGDEAHFGMPGMMWRAEPETQAVAPIPPWGSKLTPDDNNPLPPNKNDPITAPQDLQLMSLHGTEGVIPSVFLPRSFMETLLDRDTNEFMSYADPGGRGYVSRRNFGKMFVEMYRVRKQLLHLVTSQELIRRIVSRLISLLLMFLSILIFLLITGVSAETIIISGAAVISSCTVILSFFYTGLVHAIIFVCFLNPYNVADRVVMNGTLRIVKQIHTYFTEFFTVHGKIETINHSVLFDTPLCNESRAKNGGIYLEVLVDYCTPQSKCQALNYQLENFVQNHQEFVKDSFFFYIDSIVIGDYQKMVYFLTAVDSWGQFRSVWHSRGVFIRFIVQQCERLGINYRLPLKPVDKIPLR